MADFDKSIRPGDFIDPVTLLAAHAGPCFMCGRSTYCIDICFEAYFCDSKHCNDLITIDLAASEWNWVYLPLDVVGSTGVQKIGEERASLIASSNKSAPYIV